MHLNTQKLACDEKKATYLSTYTPVVGPFISVGLGLADAIWGEQFYDWVEQDL